MTTSVISDYLENELLDHVLRQQAYTSPGTTVYIALFTTVPTDTGGTEVSTAGTAYARVQCAGTSSWDAPTGNGVTANTNAINFTQATASWGEVRGVGIYDSDVEGSGNLLFYGELSAYKTVNSGDTFSIAAGDLDISLGGAFSNYLGQALLNHVLRNTAYSVPTDVYVALFISGLAAGGGGTEVSGTNYARQLCEGTGGWDLAASGATQNTGAITYTAAGSNWGTVTQVGIFDALTVGNLLFWGGLTASKTVNSGDTFRFSAGALDVAIA